MDEMIQGRPQGTSFVDFTEYEKAFDQEVDRVELGFVRIEYMLRYALDTDILQGSGYTSMEEFAYAKYKIDKSQASRFIGINRRFSEGGYSDRLKEQFKGYGVAKLGELLTLPDEIIEVLPEELSRSAVQAVKKEIREEEKISDLEVMMEEAEGSGGSLLDQWMEVYFREHPEKYLQIRNLYLSTDRERMATDILAPSGTAAETARIPGTGKMILAIKGSDQNPVLMNVRTMEKESYSWSGCVEALRRLCPYTVEPKQAYEQYYGVPFPEETPDQKPEKKPEPPRKKETPSKSQKSEKPPVAPVQQKPEKEPEAPPTEPAPPEIPQERQMELEEYQGVVPENCIVCHDGTEVLQPRETLRAEGIRLADELAQWMRTGTVSYAGQAEGMALRLAEIIRQIANEEHS